MNEWCKRNRLDYLVKAQADTLQPIYFVSSGSRSASTMIRLPNVLKRQEQPSTSKPSPHPHLHAQHHPISIRDKLLVQGVSVVEVEELERSTPPTCHVSFPSTSALHSFDLTIKPDDGFYKGGTFRFHVEVPLEYNNNPPLVKCLTRTWHPNIQEEDGAVCLSILRQTSMDGLGWSPARRLKDLVWGLNSLFSDLLDFDDPLNIEAAEHYRRDQHDFQKKIRDYIHRFC